MWFFIDKNKSSLIPYTRKAGIRELPIVEMGKLIDIPCDEILSELIIEEGEVVYGLLTSTC